MNQELQQKIDQFICAHPFIVASPIRDDSVLVPDPFYPTKVKKNMMLLQMSMRELQNDLLKEVPECTVDGNILVSELEIKKTTASGAKAYAFPIMTRLCVLALFVSK